MSYEKGLSLELVVADLFKKNGYTVIHNMKKQGKSGVEHQIDVYAEYKAPLHTSVVIIETKSYQEQIDKDKIMKFIQIVDDVKADRGIFVTTSDFTPSALMTAQEYKNIELWNRDKLTKLVGELQITSSQQGVVEKVKTEIKIVVPKIELAQIAVYATQEIEKKAKGGLFGAGKVIEKLQTIKLMLYPYYDLAVKATVIHVEKTGLFSKQEVEKIIPCNISIDAVTGELVDATTNGLSYRYAYLSRLNAEEAKLLRYAMRMKKFNVRDAMGVGYGESKTKRIINALVGKRVLEAGNSRPIEYKVKVEYPDDPSKLNALRESFSIDDYKEQGGEIIEPRIEPALVSKAIESYWESIRIDNVATIYYPYYGIWFQREDGSTRVEVIDSRSQTLNEHIASLLSR